jgi:glycosyltransferase involved in cell wall biosynthesis
MEPEKGVLDLQAAVAKAGLRALYVGEGSLRAGLQAQGGGDFRPWASHQEALRLMRRCRVVVLPSRWPETWGLVVPEAMAQGTPVVVSSQAGSAELVTRHGGGMVFDPARPGALDAALKAVLEQGPPLRRNTAAGAVRRTLSADSHGGRILDIARARWGVDLAHRPAA